MKKNWLLGMDDHDAEETHELPLRYKQFWKVSSGLISIKNTIKKFYYYGISYRTLTFWRVKGLLPKLVRVKGSKEKYFVEGEIAERLHMIYLLNSMCFFTLDEVSFLIKRTKKSAFYETMIDYVCKRMDKNKFNSYGFLMFSYHLKNMVKDGKCSVKRIENLYRKYL